MKASSLKRDWEQSPEKVIRRLQAEKLRRYLRDTVVPFSAYYRDLFQEHGLDGDSIRSLEDLQRLPFTSKSDLLNTPARPQRAKDFVLIPDQHQLARRASTVVRALIHGRERVKQEFDSEFRPIFLTSTTGRSADPIPFLFTRHDLSNLELTGLRLFQVCGASKEFRLLNMFPYAPHLAFWQAHYGATAFGVMMVSSGGGKVLGTDGQLRLLRQIKPDVIIGMPTFIYHVMRQAAEEGLVCRNLRRIVLGGEKAFEGTRRKLVQMAYELGATRIDVVSTYGFTEAKTAWAECPCAADETPSGFHLYPDLGIVEVINPKTGEVVPEGHPGELVFTPLDARGSVVLRYRTGDVIDGGLVYEPCPYCNRRAPRLVGNISRSSEVREMHLDKIKGTLVDFNQLEHVLDDAEHVGAWQLEIRKRNDDPLDLDELILHLQTPAGINAEKFSNDVSNQFAAKTEIHPNRIVFHNAEEMRRLHGVGTQIKEQKIIDHRPKVSSPATGVIANGDDLLDNHGARLPGPLVARDESPADKKSEVGS